MMFHGGMVAEWPRIKDSYLKQVMKDEGVYSWYYPEISGTSPLTYPIVGDLHGEVPDFSG